VGEEEDDTNTGADTAAQAGKKGPTLCCLQDAVKCEAVEEMEEAQWCFSLFTARHYMNSNGWSHDKSIDK
jgi:hypothetical protein